MDQATVHQWNLSVQRQLPGDMVLQVAYVGNRGERLYGQRDLNQISAAPILGDFIGMRGNLNKGCNPDGTACPAGATGQSISLVTRGIVSTAFVNSSTTRTDLQQNAAGNFAGRIEQTTLAAKLRPNQQFGTIVFMSNMADSVYHSLQTTLRRRFGNGLLFNLAYTFSKVIDDYSNDGGAYFGTSVPLVDSANLRAERGRANFDRRHLFVTTWIYELPFGPGQKWMTNAPKILNALLGGWSVQGFNSVQSGQPFSVSSGSKTAFYSTATNSRAVLAGSGKLPDASLKTKSGVIGPVFFADPSAFALAAPGQIGMGRNVFTGPAYWDVDASVAKTFRVKERTNITFRVEAFNALNHTNYRGLQNATVGSNSILSPSFGLACCQSLATSTSTGIIPSGEAYRGSHYRDAP